MTDTIYRKATPEDLPRIVELLGEAHLPAAFLGEQLHGFMVAESDGLVFGCGGMETYGDAAMLRSFAVTEQARGRGTATRLAELLMAEAKSEGLRDVYLFTMDAAEFWLHRGFVEVSIEDWREPARLGWQYAYVSTHLDEFPGLHSMWRQP
jgi:amino-acid N-acetyltransferase